MVTNFPPGSRFRPTDLGLVKLHLKSKVDENVSGFIKTLDAYGDVPWRLDHDMNPLYGRNEWYYFVKRTVRGANSVSRMVPSNGESLGGTWKATGTRIDIKNKDKELKGYKRKLVFNKNVHGKIEKEKTEWHMDEFSLHKNGDEFHDEILCHIRLVNSAERFQPHAPAPHHQVENNDIVLPNQEQQEANGFGMVEYEGGDINQHQNDQLQPQEDSLILEHRPFQSYYNQGQGLLEDIAFPNDRGYLNQNQQEDGSLILPHQIKDNLVEQYPFDDIANYHGAEDDMTCYGLMPIFNHVNQQHEQQQDSPTPLLPPLQQSNDNQEHYPLEDIAFDDNDMFDIDELLEPLPPLQSNDNHGQCPSWDTLFVPSQVDNNNNNNTVLPNQEQQEAAFPNHNVTTMVVEKEHGDVKQHHEQQKDQEQKQEDLLSFLLDPSWDDFGFDGAEDDWLMQNIDEGKKQQLQELEEDLSKLLQPVPQPQDSGVHADHQVMPKD
ncbi:hypothetical protein N665_0073s0072 [Sinapis alba]|nr:hypothetical protein N665_0073s0072 [Sinapis alba]